MPTTRHWFMAVSAELNWSITHLPSRHNDRQRSLTRGPHVHGLLHQCSAFCAEGHPSHPAGVNG
jgi:hypothetical protein